MSSAAEAVRRMALGAQKWPFSSNEADQAKLNFALAAQNDLLFVAEGAHGLKLLCAEVGCFLRLTSKIFDAFLTICMQNFKPGP